jgi:hypothetical protein
VEEVGEEGGLVAGVEVGEEKAEEDAEEGREDREEGRLVRKDETDATERAVDSLRSVHGASNDEKETMYRKKLTPTLLANSQR